MKNQTYTEMTMQEYYGIGKKPGPKMQTSEQNQEWERNRPDNYWITIQYKQWRQNTMAEYNIPKYNRKHTNDLGSHHGESRVSRADKMSGIVNVVFEHASCNRGGVKKRMKKFYSRKRRMFLKNEMNFDKI